MNVGFAGGLGIVSRLWGGLVADELVAAMIDLGPPADLVANFAVPLPATIICTLLGVPVEDHSLFA